MIESVLGLLQRGLMHTGVLLLVGTATWRWIIWPSADSALSPTALGREGRRQLEEVSRRIAAAGARVSTLLLLVWALGLVVQVLGFRDPFVPLREDVLFLLRETFWGTVWGVQGIVLLGLSLALWSLARRRSGFPAWGAVAGLATALPITLALSSHAMSESGGHRLVAVTADASHMLAAGAWMGSLALILFVGTRWDEGGPLLASQLRAFSSVAVRAVPVLIVMGGVLSVYHLTSIQDLWITTYGRVLLGKVFFAATVLLLGLLNWRRGLPSLDSEAGRRTVHRRAAFEVALAAVVLVFTSVLTGTPSP